MKSIGGRGSLARVIGSPCLPVVILSLAVASCAATPVSMSPSAQQSYSAQRSKTAAAVPEAPESVRSIIGHYGSAKTNVLLYEKGGHLLARLPDGRSVVLEWEGPDSYRTGSLRLSIARTQAGEPNALLLGGQRFARVDLGHQLEEELRAMLRAGGGDQAKLEAARRSEMTVRSDPNAASDLIRVTDLDPTIHTDIRYSTPHNLTGLAVYPPSARVLLQRPVAMALVRAHRRLRQEGLGVLLKDGYRPWYVTKFFWDSMPAEGRAYVADPNEGSRHNRGAAIDLTMFDLATGQEVEMPGRYDELSERSAADFLGGTSAQRWRRDLLRQAMEAEGFDVYPGEWWHFDFRGWERFPVLNKRFEELAEGSQ